MPVQFVGTIGEPRALQDFMSVAVGFRPLRQKRLHQRFRFHKAMGEVVQAQSTKSRLRFGHEMQLTKVAEVPGDAINGKADVQTVRRSHSSEATRKLSYIRSESAVAAVSIPLGMNRQELKQFIHQAIIIFVQAGQR